MYFAAQILLPEKSPPQTHLEVKARASRIRGLETRGRLTISVLRKLNGVPTIDYHAGAIFPVAAGAKVDRALADMFWGDRYGKLTDPFGHSWSLATHKEGVAPAEMTRRSKEAMAKMAQQTRSQPCLRTQVAHPLRR